MVAMEELEETFTYKQCVVKLRYTSSHGRTSRELVVAEMGKERPVEESEVKTLSFTCPSELWYGKQNA